MRPTNQCPYEPRVSDMMTKAELKFLEAVGYGGYAAALRQAQDLPDAVTLPGAWVQANRALGDGVCWLWRNVLGSV
jgi:hypothetical protein